MNLDYDIKKIISQIVPKDLKPLHEIIRTFENNEFFRTKSLFSNMNNKINFFKNL